MRPVRLELEGFSAYRAPTVVDFEGADLFALTGPTGAGKTAILDAIAFALYGVVHRLGNKGAVAPAISQGLVEARVRLDFTVGTDAWTAVRVVRRTKGGGASTAEARLEGPDGVVAGTADEVTAEVGRLLGLSYEHFSRCVVLPQGEFARFLHDKAADRQDLLVSLLDLGLYARMAERAGRRASEAKLEAARIEGRLAELEGATAEAVVTAAARVAELATLVDALDDELPVIAALAADEEAARAEAAARASDAERLAAVAVPADVAGLADADRVTAAALAEAEAACEAADVAAEVADVALAGLPARASLEALLSAFDRLEKATARRLAGDEVVEARRRELDEAEKELLSAGDELDAARREGERAAATHRAHAARADAVAGEPCPVCAQVITALPDEAPPADLAAATAAIDAATKALAGTESRRATAGAAVAKAEALRDAVVAEIEELTTIVGDGDRQQLLAELAALGEAEAAVKRSRAAATAARQAEKAARSAARTAADALARARSQFDEARDAVADLGAPARLGDSDLAAEWAALAAWAATEAPGRTAAATNAGGRAEELGRRRAFAVEALARRCAAAGVEVKRGQQPRDAAAAAHTRAGAAHDTLVERLADAERLRLELVAVAERRDVARTLATHLDARHFEQWVLDEAVEGLAMGATELLHTLSGGQYSLTVDRKGGFLVIDHRNADETRPARTLSGGETFLASLALALALADRIATMAAGGASRLDAIFLDEGFGTLDPDTLDVVATAIEELGAAGRMVGVVSHVAELAERVPVRFEVARVGNASTVTRVDR